MRYDITKKEKGFLAALGKNLLKIANEKKSSLERVAYEADVSKAQIYAIAKGRTNVTILILSRIADALDVPLRKLITD